MTPYVIFAKELKLLNTVYRAQLNGVDLTTCVIVIGNDVRYKKGVPEDLKQKIQLNFEAIYFGR
jgi:hypothetical protein